MKTLRNRTPLRATMTGRPCGLAFDEQTQEIVVAEYAENEELRVGSYPAGEHRVANITASEVRTAVFGWSAYTDKSRLPFNAEAPDKEILSTLIEATAATAGSTKLRFTFSRTLDRRIVLTQSPIEHVRETLDATTGWLMLQQSSVVGQSTQPVVQIETRSRALARLWLSGPVQRPETSELSTVVFLTVCATGYAAGFWSSQSGFVYEIEEPYRQGADEKQIAWHVYNNLLKMIGTSSLGNLSLGSVSHVVISCVPAIRSELSEFINDSAELKSISIESPKFLATERDETGAEELNQTVALAIGSLIESDLVARIDLSLDLATQLESVIRRENSSLQATAQRSRAAATFAILVPFIAVGFFLLSSWFFHSQAISNLKQQNAEGKETLARLKQENADYEAAKANFAVITGLIKQITLLRERQTGTYRLLVDLNQRWPGDPSWTITEVNATGPNVEIKGKTKNDQAVTAFTKNLENSDGLFSNIFVKNDAASTTAGGIPANQSPALNYVNFTVKTVYSPLGSSMPGTTPQGAPPAAAVRNPALPTAGAQPPAGVLPTQTQQPSGGQR